MEDSGRDQTYLSSTTFFARDLLTLTAGSFSDFALLASFCLTGFSIGSIDRGSIVAIAPAVSFPLFCFFASLPPSSSPLFAFRFLTTIGCLGAATAVTALTGETGWACRGNVDGMRGALALRLESKGVLDVEAALERLGVTAIISCVARGTIGGRAGKRGFVMLTDRFVAKLFQRLRRDGGCQCGVNR